MSNRLTVARHICRRAKKTSKIGNRVGHNTGGKLAHTGLTVTAKRDISDVWHFNVDSPKYFAKSFRQLQCAIKAKCGVIFDFLKTIDKCEAGDVRSLKAADTLLLLLLAPTWFSLSLASPSHWVSHLYVWDHQALVALSVVLPVVLVHFVHFHSDDDVDKPELPGTRQYTERDTPT